MAGEHLAPYHWQPGTSPNPGGKPKWWLTNGRVKDLISRVGSLPMAEIQALVEDPKTPAMECFIARVYLKGIELGDPSRLNVLLDRTIGKPVEVVEQTVKNGDLVKGISTDKLVELAKQSAA